jgi:hypothetical protein
VVTTEGHDATPTGEPPAEFATYRAFGAVGVVVVVNTSSTI